MSQYSRVNPSPRYLEMKSMYQLMHAAGDTANQIPANETFDGRSLTPHAEAINNLIHSTKSCSLLDYGCGKGGAYDNLKINLPNGETVIGLRNLWNEVEIKLYDPGYEPFKQFPQGKYDGVVSTDVLEHITKEDLNWVVDEILGFANKFVYLNIACYPAKKILPNGENAHITQETPGWWVDLVHQIKRTKYDDLVVVLAIDDKQAKRLLVHM